MLPSGKVIWWPEVKLMKMSDGVLDCGGSKGEIKKLVRKVKRERN